MHTRLRGLVALLALLTAPASAKDHLLTFGGGSSVDNNQVSLEKNVLYLQRFLADRGMGDLPHEILFSDGTAGGRDLQFTDPKSKLPRVNELLAEIFRQENGLDTQYRPHAIPKLWGPSGRKSISRWFDEVGSKLHDEDRLFIYYTGHGGRGQMRRDSTLAMWNESDMPVKEFAQLLGRLPPRVSVVLVMVQCFGGGFANVIFKDADPAKGLSARHVCGFFATSADRVAAGCTPDIDEEDYHEYSTYFWAALYGQKRTGQPVPPPDYDGNGRVSLAEAHAYALVESDTIDLSTKTSDAFLKQFSRYKRSTEEGDLLDADADYSLLLQKADPPERAALEGLSKRLELTGESRTQAARDSARGLSARRKSLERERRRLSDSHDQICVALRGMITRRWPELSNLFNPAAQRVMAQQGDQIVRDIENSPNYPELKNQDHRLQDMDDQLEELDRRWIKTQRFLNVAQHVALAANFASVAPEDLKARYRELLAAEGGTLEPSGR